MKRAARAALGLACVLLGSGAAAGGFGFRDAADGITCRSFDLATAIAWPRGQIEWSDAAGQAGGDQAYDVQAVARTMTQRVLRWDVTRLLRAWVGGSLPADGLVLRKLGPGPGGATFHSREAADLGVRPTLKVTLSDGRSKYLAPLADAYVECRSHGGTGAAELLMAGEDGPAMLRFDLRTLEGVEAAAIQSAQLILVRRPEQPWGSVSLGVFQLVTPWRQALPAPGPGLAAGFPGDRGLDRHADVHLTDGFDSGRASPLWTQGMPSPWTVVERDEARGFQPLGGAALRARVPSGDHLGLDLRYVFRDRRQDEPEEIFLRYYLRLAPDWPRTPSGGKVPGFGGTYNRAGWGGRAWDGQAGWSARGMYVNPAPGHPAAGQVLLGSYVYHRDSPSRFGEGFSWAGSDGAALLVPDRWYCIEQQVRLNTLGKDDGLLRAWVDGKPVFERTGLRLRDRATIRIENVWMDVYVGGSETAIGDMHLFIDHVVIARRYIGPMAP